MYGLSVCLGAVLHVDNEHATTGVSNVADNPVIPHPVAPEAALIVAQRFTEAPRIVIRGDAVIHIVEYFLLNAPIQALQVFLNPRVIFNYPGQVFYAVGRR